MADKPLGSRGLSLSKKQFCDIRGWTSSQFDNAVRSGMPVVDRPSGRGTDWVVFMGDAVEWEVECALKAAGHEPSEVVKLDLNAERARLAKEQADKTALDNALARGELVRASVVTRIYETVFAALRDRVMAVRSKAPILRDAALKDGVAGVRAILDSELAEALNDVGSIELVEKRAAA
jgi:phage terminase Nu1 subunit (DNA packaging protein)